MTSLTCFGAYDIRGRLGVDLDEGIAQRIGRAFADTVAARTIVLGRDVRPTSEGLARAVARGLTEAGCTVLDLGLSGTEEMYHATSHFGADGGLCVTASHNPIAYNGMKMVGAGSAPLGSDILDRIKKLAEAEAADGPGGGAVRDVAAQARAAYVARVIAFVDPAALRPLKIVVNAGHGAAGPTFDAIADALASRGAPLTFQRLFHAPDGRFPQGMPNPMLERNRPHTADAVRRAGADFGVAWDGDFDRCFFFDQTGTFIDGEYVVGLLAKAFLAKTPGATIVHDPRLVWNTQDLVTRAGGHAIQSRTGHAFMKRTMRDTDAAYGGEMSAHHYFRDFFYCDSGMIPLLLMAELVSRNGPLADMVGDRRAAFPSSGEVNYALHDPRAAIARVEAAFAAPARGVDRIDGLSVDMGTWRFNLRRSNTESLVRLNVEARHDADLVRRGITRIEALLLA